MRRWPIPGISYIPRYDFNWQLLYRLAQPRTLRRGDTIQFTAWFDNSEDNPANPDPTRTVRWGPQIEDEMHLGYVEYIIPGHEPGAPVANMRRRSVRGAVRGLVGNALFKRLDVNRDGNITRAEVRERLPNNARASGATFDQLDMDGNGTLNRAELARLGELSQ